MTGKVSAISYIMTQLQAKRYTLDSLKARVIAEAERAQIATQNYINQLTIRASEIENKAVVLDEEIAKLRDSAKKLRDNAMAAKNAADEAFKDSLSEVVSSFGLEVPWKATIVYNEGIAIGLDIEKEESPAEPGQETGGDVSNR